MKKTRFDSLVWLIAAVVAGVLSAILRRWQLSTAFEGHLRLPIPMAPASVALVALYILGAAVFVFLARRRPAAPVLKDSPALAFRAVNDLLFLGAVVCAAFLALIAAPVLFREGREMWAAYQTAKAYSAYIPGGNNGLLVLAAAVTSALAFVGLLLSGKAACRGTEKGRLAILFPAVNNCLWLMEIYRAQAANPVQWDYVPLLLAIVSGILFYLNWAGLCAGAFIPRRTLWTAGMTVLLSASALAGEWTLGSALLLTSQLLAALAALWLLPANIEFPPEHPAQAAPIEVEKLEEETHE